MCVLKKKNVYLLSIHSCNIYNQLYIDNNNNNNNNNDNNNNNNNNRSYARACVCVRGDGDDGDGGHGLSFENGTRGSADIASGLPAKHRVRGIWHYYYQCRRRRHSTLADYTTHTHTYILYNSVTRPRRRRRRRVFGVCERHVRGSGRRAPRALLLQLLSWHKQTRNKLIPIILHWSDDATPTTLPPLRRPRAVRTTACRASRTAQTHANSDRGVRLKIGTTNFFCPRGPSERRASAPKTRSISISDSPRGAAVKQRDIPLWENFTVC